MECGSSPEVWAIASKDMSTLGCAAASNNDNACPEGYEDIFDTNH
ncbi:hypothetical protein FPSE_09672 [Fusarium pseudograminearum CS3096]|uniref:Uncharacterized protein n=1 Tax=Fusarium pseudograminearum (strain CS3096) TaxID=1028729 RepID=K3UER9_FUSPC|nr:hypothetical protein FPSE_09672 [Fusarium pseudograminearum CS3096]EKJ70146.1 hypothetical protein FPSE_09672 [Fusarium pseudograminearum CS3096]